MSSIIVLTIVLVIFGVAVYRMLKEDWSEKTSNDE